MKSFTLILVILFYASAGFARIGGSMDSGGGGAFLCSNPTDQSEYTILVDLWESQHLVYYWPSGATGTLNIQRSDADVETQIHQALLKLSQVDRHFADLVQKELNYIQSTYEYLPPGVSIKLPDDLDFEYYPEGCRAVGMMHYEGVTDRLNIKKSYFSKLLSNTDIAASYLHEAIYKVMRLYGQTHTTSSLSRRLNACLFSTDKCLQSKTWQQHLPEKGSVFKCSSKQFEFYIYSTEEDGFKHHTENQWAYLFSKFNGNSVPYSKPQFFNLYRWEDYDNSSRFDPFMSMTDSTEYEGGYHTPKYNWGPLKAGLENFNYSPGEIKKLDLEINLKTNKVSFKMLGLSHGNFFNEADNLSASGINCEMIRK